MARRYFNSRRRHFNFSVRELGFLGLLFSVVLMIGERRNAELLGLFFQQYGAALISLIVLIVGAGLYIHIRKKRLRRQEEETRFLAVRLVDLHSINPTGFEEYVARVLKHRGYKTKVIGQAGIWGSMLSPARPAKNTQFRSARTASQSHGQR